MPNKACIVLARPSRNQIINFAQELTYSQLQIASPHATNSSITHIVESYLFPNRPRSKSIRQEQTRPDHKPSIIEKEGNLPAVAHAERNLPSGTLINVLTAGASRARTVPLELVLRVADLDARAVLRAVVRAGRRAPPEVAVALRLGLLGGRRIVGEAVRQVVVGVVCAGGSGWARANLLL